MKFARLETFFGCLGAGALDMASPRGLFASRTSRSTSLPLAQIDVNPRIKPIYTISLGIITHEF